MILTTNINAVGNEKNFFEALLKKTFLENGEPSTVFMKLGEKPIPHRGYDSVTWARLSPMKLSADDVELTE